MADLDDGPPPLEEVSGSAKPTSSATGAGSGSGVMTSAGTDARMPSTEGVGAGSGGDEATLMEQMMAAAGAARKAKEAAAAKKRAEESKTFGAGLSGGFFAKPKPAKGPSSKTKTKTKAKAKAATTAKPVKPVVAPPPAPVVRRCDNYDCRKLEKDIKAAGGKFLRCGRCKTTRYCSRDCQKAHWKAGHKSACGKDPETIEFSVPKSSSSSSTSSPADPLRLPEVQAAMSRTAEGMAAKLSDGAWITPDFMSKFASKPKLLKAMGDPRFNAVLQEMQKNPGAALAKCKDDPEMTELLTSFMQLMGDHFTELGAKEDKEKKKKKKTQDK